MKPIKHLFEVCTLLLTMSLLFTLFGVIGYRPKEVCVVESEVEQVIVTPTVTPTPTPAPEPEEPIIPESLEVYKELYREMGQVILTCKRIIFVNEYRAFFTAYCAEECGYRVYEDGSDNYPAGHITSTGTICHRSSEFMRYEPSTCGVDPRYFAYGTLFYVPSEDRVYVAEDTGYISGAWIDTYQTSMEEMLAYDVRYENVWTIQFEEYEVLSSNYNVRPIIADMFLGIER
jgi:3D (Asp-Asp-Asp) domain-containing protein